MTEVKTPTPGKGNLDFLHKQVGPLPVGGWLLVVGAGLAFSYWRKRQAGTTTNSEEGLQPSFTDETVGNVFALVNALNKGGTGVPTAAVTDNTTWYRRAVTELLGRGFATTLVDSALRKYMQGMALTREEQAAVDKAIEIIGPLPSPPPPPPTTGPSQPSNVTKNLSTYKVQELGDTLTHLSNEQLINASNITFEGFLGEGVGDYTRSIWAEAVGDQPGYGTSDPIAYMNEIARRYQSGSLGERDLIGPVGPWTGGQPAWRLTLQELGDRLRILSGSDSSIQFG
jgi:hypothetical protein